MAANKFATMVHNNTNKITLVLIYALLEWTLIVLLLLNSIFSYFIIKFTQFFGLKPPCIWCIHLHRFFEPQNKNSHRDLLCEFHSKEVSQLGFCSKHLKLAESHDMCQDCSSGFDEEIEVCLKCSCCGVGFKRKRFDDSVIDLTESDLVRGDFGGNHEVQKQGIDTEEIEIESLKGGFIQIEKREDLDCEKPTQDLEFCLDYSGNQLVPIESIDPIAEVDEDKETRFVLEIGVGEAEKTEESSKFVELDSMEFEETENSLVFHVNSNVNHDENTSISEPIQKTEREHEEEEVSIGTEIPVLDSCDEMKAQENFNLYSLSREEHSKSSHDLDFNLECGFEETQEDGKTKELLIEGKELIVDESFDGREMDKGDAINTTEKLKSALRAERKALQALYIELEEERSASAVAASETMAMINRLQEERAAMQMEALHYQRMMEEQSEYDQEALQLLNELMVKKEKELELYRKKVLDYEMKERLRFSTSSVKSNACSASCSHSEDGDGVWVDMNNEPQEEGFPNGNQESGDQNATVVTKFNRDSSFVDFEDERLSILENLKVLEEKLVTLSNDEDQHFSDLRHIEDYFEENGKHLNWDYNFDGQQVNGVTNGLANELDEVHYQDRRAICSTGKRPFPIFEEVETESDDGVTTSNGNGNGFHSQNVENTSVTIFELQKRRIDIEEEVDQLYVRLQALEADREFLKHSIGSLKKGDKGMKLLQEILQHLRDLRNIDIREKSFTDGTLV